MLRWLRSASVRLLVAALVGAVCLEVFTWTLFRWPDLWLGRIPQRMQFQLLRYHFAYLTGTPVQFRPECAEWDVELMYRLRPGSCRFATDEFDTTVRVSPRGLREDQEVNDPELLVLGDSFTLGWGVEREAAYPALIAKNLGIREVVVADSSYGTVRESLLLRRLALADFKAVVIQYCWNDLQENMSYLKAGRHVSAPQSTYAEWVGISAKIADKRLLKRSRHWFSLVWSDVFGTRRADPRASAPEHARMFLQILEAFAADLRGRPVLVLVADAGDQESPFIQAVNDLPKSPRLGPIRAIETGSLLSRTDFFQMDPHWKPSGHRIIAAAVEKGLSDLVPDLGRP